ncbi:hypothetical protein [cf. Phormidesmis sp. LEGE 11477]|uniref:hypothetical protein n=1 Tax=cf. Phormidesmis sp. LEGE 11477 TaxID=1828680 RepID=UPI001D153157|nr:hypothetical protein [cf. Phormidesmis sp. LEGE 11477]
MSGGKKPREKFKPPQLAKSQGGYGMINHNLLHCLLVSGASCRWLFQQSSSAA